MACVFPFNFHDVSVYVLYIHPIVLQSKKTAHHCSFSNKSALQSDSKVDAMSKNSSQLGPSAPLNTLNNGFENGNVDIESFANQRTANGDPASIPSVITQLLQMLEATKARHSANLHTTEESSPLSDRTVSEDPSTDTVS